MRLLSQIWGVVQGTLYPFLEEDHGPLTEKQKQVIRILEVARVEELVQYNKRRRGRNPHERQKIARAFVIKAVYNLDSNRALIDLLEGSSLLRRICGYEFNQKIPHESTFSRVFNEFTKTELPQRVHENLIKTHRAETLVGHISRDSSAIEGNEKPVPKPKQESSQPKRKRGRPRKGEEVPKEPTRLQKQQEMTVEEMIADLPQECDRGTKKNSQGHTITWIGYKLHLDCADGQIPISCLLTSASVHDSQVAIPLMEKSSKRVTSLYDLMDSAYDAKEIREHAQSLGHVPIIDHNPRRGETIEMEPAQKVRYKERSAVERVFGRLKEEFGGKKVKVRGSQKVMTHLMFGVLALTADQLLRLVS